MSGVGPAEANDLQPYGNAAAAQGLGSVASQLPAGIDLRSVGVSFRVPPNVILSDTFLSDVTTGAGATVYVRLSERALEVSFWPPLFVDARWPLSNVEIHGFTYDFASGTVSRVNASNTQTLAIGITGNVGDELRSFVGGLVRGTPVGRPGYNPLTDPDPQGTLEALKANAGGAGPAGGGGASPLGAGDLTRITPTATIALREEILQGTGEGGVRIPAGTPITVSAGLAGSAQDLATSGVSTVDWVSLSTDGIELRTDSGPVAMLHELTFRHGGAVEVGRFTPLGKLADAADTESGIRALFALFQLAAAQQGGYTGPIQTNINPDLVTGVAGSQIGRALSSAIRGVIEQHHDAVPGVDLRTVLGIPATPSAGAAPRR